MANVYRAQRVGVAGFERTVVVKCILDSHHADQAFLKMFINEAKLAARLTHPNIVQVHELGEVGGEYFMAMEYVHGRDLLRVLRQVAKLQLSSGALPPEVAAYIARETCRALGHAHSNSDETGRPRPIIHRDVSPQNIMVSYDGQVKLVDFGIAKALNSVTNNDTRTGSLKGKFAYMAPEQIKGGTPGPQTDVFSVGVVLHETLTGQRLFKGATDYETLSNVRLMPIPKPSSILSTVPAVLDEIVAKALDRDRTVRYTTASAMAKDLDGILANARFASEDMAAYMNQLFPAGERKEPSALPAMPPTLDSDRVESNMSPMTLPDTTPMHVGAGLARRVRLSSKEPSETSVVSNLTSAQTPSAREEASRKATGGLAFGSFIVAVTGLAFGVAYWLGRPHARTQLAIATVPVAVAAAPAVLDAASLAAPTPTEVAPTPPEPAAEPAGAVVEVNSEPRGAHVYEGPRLVGTAPLVMKVPESGIAVTLVHPGFAELSYRLTESDGPVVTLRLTPAHRGAKVRLRSSGKSNDDDLGESPARRSNRKPKVDTLDD